MKKVINMDEIKEKNVWFVLLLLTINYYHRYTYTDLTFSLWLFNALQKKVVIYLE